MQNNWTVELQSPDKEEFERLYREIVIGKAAEKEIMGRATRIAIAAGVPPNLAETSIYTGTSILVIAPTENPEHNTGV